MADSLTRMQRASKSKALGLLASRGSWEECEALLSELGEQAWREHSLMGPSPEAMAFERALFQGDAPPWELLASIETSKERSEQLEARAMQAWKNSAPSAKVVECVARYLGAAASAEPWSEAFGALSGAGEGALAGWVGAMARKSRRSELSRRWRSSLGLWRCAGKVSNVDREAFVASLSAGGIFAPMLAAAKGARKLAASWIEALDSKEALALWSASASTGSADWIEFKSRLPIEPLEDEHVWDRRLARSSGGAIYFDGDGENDLTHLLRELWRPEAEGEQRGWDEAMRACALKAASALAGQQMETAREWLRKNTLPELAQLAMDGLEESYDFEVLDADASVELMVRLAKADSNGLAKASRGCARRLGKVRESSDEATKKKLGIQVGSCAKSLWASSSAEGFEAFVLEWADIFGSREQALRACGFPFPALSRDWASPGSPGHMIALLRLAPAELADDGSGSMWGDAKGWERLAESLWERVSSAAVMSALDNGVSRSLSSSETSAISSLGPIDISERSWQKISGPEQALKSWEAAIEAVSVHAAKMSSLFEARDGSGRSRFGSASRPPPMKSEGFWIGALGWRVHAKSHPEDAACWLVEQWCQGNQAAMFASKICEGLDEGSKKVLASNLPGAFEKWSQTWSAFERSDSEMSLLAQACRLGATSLSSETSDSDAFGEREALCSACLACVAYAMALVAGKETLAGRKSASFYQAAKSVAPLLPQAVLALASSWQGGLEGYSSDDLIGKAAWGAVCFESLGVGRAQAWSERWHGVDMKSGNAWLESCLCAALSPEALLNSTPESVLAAVSDASSWLAGFGGNGWERPDPQEHSALERAVDCRMRQGKIEGRHEEGCHGIEIVKFLVASGANPSCQAAPRGMDAMAICSNLARKESPSSVMKALEKSKLANPGAGALLSMLSSNKHGLSSALAEALAERACKEPTLASLARLGAMMPDMRALKALSSCLGAGRAARSWGPVLLGAMASGGADAGACASVRMVLDKEGISPSEDSVRRLRLAAWSEFKKVEPPYDCERKMSHWLDAGAGTGALPLELIPSESWRSDWLAFSLGGDPCLGEAILSRAWACEISKPRSGIARAASWARIALALPPAMRGPRFGEAARACLAKWQEGDSWSSMGPAISSEDFAALERCALDEGSEKPAGPSRRL